MDATPRSGAIRVQDVPTLLLQERIIVLPPTINAETAHSITGMLLYLENKDATQDIQLHIDCIGEVPGLFYHGLGIYDTMQLIKPDIVTICIGMAQGVAAVLLAGGAKGKRYCLPHASVILHQPYSGVQGQAVDIDIRAREIVRQRQVFYEILAQHTNQSLESIKQSADRLSYFTAEQALEYGLVDEIIKPATSKL